MNKNNLAKIWGRIGILAVILLLIFFGYLGALDGARNLAYWASSPFLRFFQLVDAKISGAVSFALTIKDLSRENSALRLSNQKLWQENSGLQETARENEMLRQRLDITTPENYRLVLGNVVGQYLESGQYLLVDRGSRDGLRVGQAAITANNFLVGKIVQADDNFAKIMLILDSGLTVNVISQETRVSGLVKGRHGLGLSMEMIPVDAQLRSGETVLTSGLNDSIPKGLIVGQIKEIIKQASDIFQRADITPAVDFDRLEQVFILTQ